MPGGRGFGVPPAKFDLQHTSSQAFEERVELRSQCQCAAMLGGFSRLAQLEEPAQIAERSAIPPFLTGDQAHEQFVVGNAPGSPEGHEVVEFDGEAPGALVVERTLGQGDRGRSDQPLIPLQRGYVGGDRPRRGTGLEQAAPRVRRPEQIVEVVLGRVCALRKSDQFAACDGRLHAIEQERDRTRGRVQFEGPLQDQAHGVGVDERPVMAGRGVPLEGPGKRVFALSGSSGGSDRDERPRAEQFQPVVIAEIRAALRKPGLENLRDRRGPIGDRSARGELPGVLDRAEQAMLIQIALTWMVGLQFHRGVCVHESVQ